MLIDALENASDEEIVEANKKLKLNAARKLIIGIGTSVAIHFVSNFLVTVIESRMNRENTD